MVWVWNALHSSWFNCSGLKWWLQWEVWNVRGGAELENVMCWVGFRVSYPQLPLVSLCFLSSMMRAVAVHHTFLPPWCWVQAHGGKPLLTEPSETLGFHFHQVAMLSILVTWVQKCLLHSVGETLGPLHMTAVALCEPGGDLLKQIVLGSDTIKPLVG